MSRPNMTRAALSGLALTALSACSEPLDLDLRSLGNGFDTTQNVQSLASRPEPDDRGVISYPGYQVAVARRGDRVGDIAGRLGIDAAALARFNGIDPEVPLRRGEVIALPSRVAEPSPATGALAAPRVDVTTLASNAIDAADPGGPAPRTAPATPAVGTGPEPIRHRVERGETAFTVARLYNVPVRNLAEWNGLGAELEVREGQFLLIPVEAVTAGSATAATPVAAPGTGTATPVPPSSTAALPDEAPEITAPVTANAEPPVESPDLASERSEASAPSAQFARPAEGSVIRAYAPGRNEGIDIGAPAGAPVRAAAAGSVAAVTETESGVNIVVIRHEGGLLTVYTNISDLAVSRGDSVSRGQQIASVDAGDPSFLHFEVRDGTSSVDPEDFL